MSLVIKWLLVLVVVGLAYHWWRRNRMTQEPPTRAASPATPSAGVRVMVKCRHCGLDADPEEMITGRLGHYCSHDHRQAQGDEPI